MSSLYTILIILLVVAIFAWLSTKLVVSSNLFGRSYYKKSQLLNESELALYINLVKELGSDYLVFSKVRIEDFVGATHNGIANNNFYGNRGRIKSRHVDFLICDHFDTKPLLAIELDGGSHNRLDRINRDNFVDGLYTQIKLPYRHILVGADFAAEARAIKQIVQVIN